MPLPDDFLPLIDIPEPLKAPLGRTHERLAEALAQANNLAGMTGRESPLEDWLGLSSGRREQLARVLAISEFVAETLTDRKSTRLNSSHVRISYAVFCLKKKKVTRDHVELDSVVGVAQRARGPGV